MIPSSIWARVRQRLVGKGLLQGRNLVETWGVKEGNKKPGTFTFYTDT